MGVKVPSIYGLVAASVAAAAPASGQSVQYRSAAGVEYRAQRDTGAIARAESALAAEPRNVERIIQLGLAQSGARQFREAIDVHARTDDRADRRGAVSLARPSLPLGARVRPRAGRPHARQA